MSAKKRFPRVLTAGVALLALTTGACSGGAHNPPGTSTPPSTRSTSSAPATRTTTASPAAVDPLTGGRRTGRPVIAVKLENTSAAMPQYGLSAADLVFVEEVEGSLTRLMPIYEGNYPSRVEPVRSARSTDIGILPMFGKPLLVYSGVASQIASKLRNAPIRLDDNGIRDGSRVAPHNLYFDLATIARLKGLATSKDIGLRFSTHDARISAAPTRPTFTVQVGADRFSFSYQDGHYLPSWNGRPYTDVGAGGRRVTAQNVLVLHVRTVSDGYLDPAGNPVYKSLTTGSGTLDLYRNGKEVSGTWHRAASGAVFHLVDAHGKQLTLQPGKTWILLQG